MALAVALNTSQMPYYSEVCIESKRVCTLVILTAILTVLIVWPVHCSAGGAWSATLGEEATDSAVLWESFSHGKRSGLF